MSFVPKNWENSPSVATPITADELNRIEQGVGSSLRVRGTLPPEITSLDELNSRAWNGLWQLPASSTIAGVPFALTQSTFVEILVGSPAYSSKQVVSDQYQSYWRDASYAIPSTVTVWGEWQKFISESDISGSVRARGYLPAGDISDLFRSSDAGVYELQITYSEYEGIPSHPEIHPTNHPTLVVHVSGGVYASAQTIYFRSIHGNTIQAYREYQSSTLGYSEWTLTGVSTGASSAILDLARRDGWTAVYDPTNEGPLTIGENGTVTRIADGLGNLPALTKYPSQTAPKLLAGEYGQLAGLKNGSFYMAFDQIEEDMTMMTLATPAPSPEGHDWTHQYLVGGLIGGCYDIYFGGNPPATQWSFGRGVVTYGREIDFGKPVIVESTFVPDDNSESKLLVNGQNQVRGLTSGSNVPRSMSLGDYTGVGSHPWLGSFGVHLVYVGKISQEKKNRMRKLLQSLTGIKDDPAPFNAETRVLTVDGRDNVIQAKGDPDAIYNDAVASITKIIAALMLRKYLPEAEWDDEVTMQSEDYFNGDFNYIRPGDTLTWRNAVRAMMKNSDNNVSGMIARELHTRFFPTKYPGMTYYQAALQEADTLLNEEWGCKDACVRNFNGNARLSPRHIAKLFRRIISDPILRDTANADQVTFQITGSDPRSFTARHTVESVSEGDYIAKKIGNTGIRRHTVTAWEHPTTGEEMLTVIQDVYSPSWQTGNSRIVEYEVAQDAVLSGSETINTAKPYLAGQEVKTTHQRVMTDAFGVTGGEVYLVRTDSTAQMTFSAVTLPENYYDLRAVPVGFRPAVQQHFPVVSSTGTARNLRMTENGTLEILGSSTTETYDFTITWAVPAEYSQNFPSPPWPGKNFNAQNGPSTIT